ncbi:alpha/beta family hydrolase [Colwellia piezophila]|uniref:alpha/beta family hydrolase n=1 Tax=Colwellia piezophila TaxID=211668 RepID=UPI00035F1C90|nr:alpha/beta family hydrolase [Colwellia piezophila]
MVQILIQPQVITPKVGSNINLQLNIVDNAKAQVIFAHGAGANMSHEFMEETTLLLNKVNINVIRFNFPFMDKRALTGTRYPPDRMPKLLVCYETVIEHVIEQQKNSLIPLFIGGKSMGSRAAASLVSISDSLKPKALNKVLGVFCLGYPFHPAKKPEKLRLEPLFESSKAVLIIQGDRDTLGNKEEIHSYQLPEHCHCVFLEDGDHSLKPRVKSGFTQQAHMKSAVDEISFFIDRQIKTSNQ